MPSPAAAPQALSRVPFRPPHAIVNSVRGCFRRHFDRLHYLIFTTKAPDRRWDRVQRVYPRSAKRHQAVDCRSVFVRMFLELMRGSCKYNCHVTPINFTIRQSRRSICDALAVWWSALQPVEICSRLERAYGRIRWICFIFVCPCLDLLIVKKCHSKQILRHVY